ncbi:EpsG family protein [Pseudomonas corrugata]|uniref:EpsG family protein n=1 Tax=Pseudomonas corrugata TaxID=47879 RepID=UPI001585F27F|nr:EpsG family protein [Pseudomonas corrugata]MCI0994211.1 EpsG family protein [Pseudomonas corrugata]NUT67397.1 EpsG family protein [Pseudomonas corrugata]
MMQYNIIYALIWMLALLSLKKTTFPSVVIYAFQVTLLSLFVGLKFQTGYDWPIYESHYNAIRSGEEFYLDFEFGYEWLVHASAFLDLPFEHFSALVSIIEVVFISIVVRNVFPRHCLLVLAVMYSIPDFYLIPTFSLIRQGLAVSIFLLGVNKFLSERRSLAFLLFVIAASIHYSVLGGVLLLLLIYWFPISRATFLIVFLISVALYLSSVDLIRGAVEILIVYVNPKYMIYLDRDVFNASFAYRAAYVLVSVVVFSSIYLAWGNSGAQNNINQLASPVLYRLAFAGLLIPLIIFGFPTLSTRYQYFFAVFLIGAAMNILLCLNFRSRLVAVFVIAVVAYLPFYRFLSSPLSIVYIPYQSQLFYDERNSTGQERTNNLLNQLDELWSK